MKEKDVAEVVDGGARIWAAIDAALDRGEIDEVGWHQRVADVVRDAYLRADNPRAQSGFSGDEARWEVARGAVADALHKDGTLLDVGCASGLLMESVQRWGLERHLLIEPYGLDIVPELADLARQRLPQWSHRIFSGNVMHWNPPFKFDFVRCCLDYVPRRSRAALLQRLKGMVNPGGRVIIGVYNEARDARPSLQDETTASGFLVGGSLEVAHSDARVVRRLFWLDTPSTR